MIKKNVAIALVVIAVVLVAFVAYDYFFVESKVPTVSNNQDISDQGAGKVGVTILTPSVEDKSDGS
jgi:hypothetical protein